MQAKEDFVAESTTVSLKGHGNEVDFPRFLHKSVRSTTPPTGRIGESAIECLKENSLLRSVVDTLTNFE